jgi:hypothetical protein
LELDCPENSHLYSLGLKIGKIWKPLDLIIIFDDWTKPNWENHQVSHGIMGLPHLGGLLQE